MNTPGHAVVSLAALGGRERRARHVPLVLGAVLPDVPMAVFYLDAKIRQGLPESVIWSEAYFRPGWQPVFDLFHSIPVAAAAAAVAWWVGRTGVAWAGGSAVLHDLVDLPLHAGDAHAHFVPLTDWRFRSPVSYWDSERFGDVAGPLEAVLVLGLAAVVWPRLETRWGRGLLAAAAGLYVLGLGVFLWV